MNTAWIYPASLPCSPGGIDFCLLPADDGEQYRGISIRFMQFPAIMLLLPAASREKHILGTQLGPNENGHAWPSRKQRRGAGL